MPSYWMRKIKTTITTYEVYTAPPNTSARWVLKDGRVVRSTRVGEPEIETVEELRELSESERALIQSVIVTPESDDD